MWRVSFSIVLLSSFAFIGCANEPTTLGGYGTEGYTTPAPRAEPPPEELPSFDDHIGESENRVVAGSFQGSIGQLDGFDYQNAYVSGGSWDRRTTLYLDATGDNGSAMLVLEAGASIFDLAAGRATSPPAPLAGVACSASPGSGVWEDEVDVDGFDVGEPVLLSGGMLSFDIRVRFNFEGRDQLVDASVVVEAP